MARRTVLAMLGAAGVALLAACSQDGASTGFRSTPGAPPADSFVLTAAGDIGSGAEASATLEQIPRLGADAHLALGDLSYGEPGAEEAWCRFVADRVGAGFPFQLVPGNHEAAGEDGDIAAFATCLPNRLPGLVGDYPRQYVVDVPASEPLARLVVISPGVAFRDDTWDDTSDAWRAAWTREAIEDARDDGIPWVVVAMHKPCLSLGEYGCDPGPGNVDLLVESGADLVITGHEHLYQRTAQLGIGDGCESIAPEAISRSCVVDRGSELTAGAGTVFVTVGTGGTALREVHLGDPDAGSFAAWSGLNHRPSWGNLRVRLTPARMTVEFVPAIGSFVDEFRIERPPEAANTG